MHQPETEYKSEVLPVASLLRSLTKQGLRETPLCCEGQPELPGARLKGVSDPREATVLTALAQCFPKVGSVVWGVLFHVPFLPIVTGG